MVQKKIVLGLPGLGCVACVSQIESAVRAQDGVIWAILNYAAEEIVIIYDPSTISPKRLEAVVQHLGFDPSLKDARVTEGPEQAGHESPPVDSSHASLRRTTAEATPSEERGRRSGRGFVHMAH